MQNGDVEGVLSLWEVHSAFHSGEEDKATKAPSVANILMLKCGTAKNRNCEILNEAS